MVLQLESGGSPQPNVCPSVQPKHRNMPNSNSKQLGEPGSNMRNSSSKQLGHMPNSTSEEPGSNMQNSSSKQLGHMPNNTSEEPGSNMQNSSSKQQGHMPNSTSEEPINGTFSNVGGSCAHQQQLFEARLALEVFLAGRNHSIYRPLYIAAKTGDWKSGKTFIDRDRDALTARISYYSGTVLHVAAKFCQWGFIRKLLDQYDLSRESIAMKDIEGSTVLHLVAIGGSFETAKVLIRKNPDLVQIINNKGDPPLIPSIWSESKELVWYLILRTKLELPSLPMVVRILIQSGHLDIVLYLVQKHPKLVLVYDEFGFSLLYRLACRPSYFYSGSKLGFVERWIYKFVHVDTNYISTHSVNMEDVENLVERTEDCLVFLTATQPRSFVTRVVRWYKRLKLWKLATAGQAPCIKKVRDAKLRHQCAVELVERVCEQLCDSSYGQILDFFHKENTLFAATESGIEEIVRAILQDFPDLIHFKTPFRTILQVAIENRQEKIVNIIKDISMTTIKDLSSYRIESGNTTLHLAGRLAPASTLYSVSGAALQMQRELQWFKEVEKLHPYQREWRNCRMQTAKDVFRKEHRKLAADGEKWMKDTANSCMLVSVLIATVLFAATFTVPGGNINDKGIPIFLGTNAFAVFAISNALGLSFSLASLLMFLAILTARYAIEDFLESLPKRLIVGLGSLFLAIAAMITTFGAALTIVLIDRWQWAFIPIILLAFFPLAIFLKLQLPLFIQMVRSTYGSGMFHH